MSDQSLPLVMKVDEVAAVLRVGLAAAYQLVREGTLPAVKVGRSLRVPSSAVLRFLDRPVSAHE